MNKKLLVRNSPRTEHRHRAVESPTGAAWEQRGRDLEAPRCGGRRVPTSPREREEQTSRGCNLPAWMKRHRDKCTLRPEQSQAR